MTKRKISAIRENLPQIESLSDYPSSSFRPRNSRSRSISRSPTPRKPRKNITETKLELVQFPVNENTLVSRTLFLRFARPSALFLASSSFFHPISLRLASLPLTPSEFRRTNGGERLVFPCNPGAPTLFPGESWKPAEEQGRPCFVSSRFHHPFVRIAPPLNVRYTPNDLVRTLPHPHPLANNSQLLTSTKASLFPPFLSRRFFFVSKENRESIIGLDRISDRSFHPPNCVRPITGPLVFSLSLSLSG